jgi:hypothetical protein
MNKCINCGKQVKVKGRFVVCGDCEKTGKEMEKLLHSGLTLGYSDGHVETLELKDSGDTE